MDILNSLGINFKVVLVQIVAFLLLFWILKKFLFTRIAEHMQSRSEEIKNTFDKIEKDKQEVERLTKEYQQKIAEIEKEAYAKIQEAVKEGISAKNEIVTQAQTQAQKELKKAKDEIGREKEKAILELRNEVINLSLKAAEKLLDTSMDEKTNSKLVDKFLTDIEETRHR